MADGNASTTRSSRHAAGQGSMSQTTSARRGMAHEISLEEPDGDSPLLPQSSSQPILPAPPQAMNPLWKTRICSFFTRKGCRHGSVCTFAHGLEELREAPDFTKTSICPDLLKNGTCLAVSGECPYAHEKAELRSSPGLLKTRMCDFHRRGTCIAGEACRFAHQVTELKGAADAFLETSGMRLPSDLGQAVEEAAVLTPSGGLSLVQGSSEGPPARSRLLKEPRSPVSSMAGPPLMEWRVSDPSTFLSRSRSVSGSQISMLSMQGASDSGVEFRLNIEGTEDLQDEGEPCWERFSTISTSEPVLNEVTLSHQNTPLSLGLEGAQPPILTSSDQGLAWSPLHDVEVMAGNLRALGVHVPDVGSSSAPISAGGRYTSVGSEASALPTTAVGSSSGLWVPQPESAFTFSTVPSPPWPSALVPPVSQRSSPGVREPPGLGRKGESGCRVTNISRASEQAPAPPSTGAAAPSFSAANEQEIDESILMLQRWNGLSPEARALILAHMEVQPRAGQPALLSCASQARKRTRRRTRKHIVAEEARPGAVVLPAGPLQPGVALLQAPHVSGTRASSSGVLGVVAGSAADTTGFTEKLGELARQWELLQAQGIGQDELRQVLEWQAPELDAAKADVDRVNNRLRSITQFLAGFLSGRASLETHAASPGGFPSQR